MTSIIPKSEFVDGAYYEGTCRNATVAMWSAKRNKFLYVRTKFCDRFIDELECAEDDIGYDIFLPFKRTEPTEAQKVWET